MHTCVYVRAHLGHGVALELDDHAHAVAVALVAQVGNACAHEHSTYKAHQSTYKAHEGTCGQESAGAQEPTRADKTTSERECTCK
jgi:uncharacterized low-complexity protein